MKFLISAIEALAKKVKEPDLDTLDGIASIEIPRYKPIHGLASPTQNIEYILQRKATEHKRNGRMDLAIACLRKANEIMPHSNYTWQAKDYLRLVSYLRQNGQVEEAQREEERLRRELPEVFMSTSAKAATSNREKTRSIQARGYDLVQIDEHYPTCAECAKYQGRVFSISGKDKRFPRLPDHIRCSGTIHDGCRHVILPYVESLKTASEIRNAITFSNRPFVDSRGAEERALWDRRQAEQAQMQQDAKEYEAICTRLPDAAPKSFSGYRQMKKAKSKNYLSLVAKAEGVGIKIMEVGQQ